MDRHPTKAADIPNAPYYVLGEDTFFHDTTILPCESWQEACIVEQNSHFRTDQKRVRVVMNKPRLRKNHRYTVITKDTASRWYTLGGFNPLND